MRKILALYFLFVFSSCRNAVHKGDIEVLYKERKYSYIVNNFYDLKSKLDTALYFSSLCQTDKFNEAIEIFNEPDKYQVVGGWVFRKQVVDTLCSIHNFPYAKYNSFELLMLAQYYDQRYNAYLIFIDRLLRESIKKDSGNVYSLYFLAKLGILSKEYEKVCFLITRILEKDSWESVSKMKKFIGQDCESGTSLQNINSIEQITNEPVYVYDVDISNYERF